MCESSLRLAVTSYEIREWEFEGMHKISGKDAYNKVRSTHISTAPVKEREDVMTCGNGQMSD